MSSDDGRLVAQVDCDAKGLAAATTAGDSRRALHGYRGPYLDSYPVSVGAELETWILDTRDYLGGSFGSSHVDGSLEQIEKGEMQRAMPGFSAETSIDVVE